MQDIIAALELPGSCRVDQRVPKKLLVENGAPTAGDKRQINDSIEEIQWLAALKPNTIGVPLYRDDVREYLEIAVLSVTLRGAYDKPAKAGRLAELVHRAVPYPMVLLLNSEQTLMLSLAHKRWAQNEVGKVVLDGGMVEVALPGAAPASAVESAFMRVLALGHQPQATLYALYQGWMDNLEALLAARLTGNFKDANNPEQAAVRRQGLQDCQRLELEAVSLRARAAKEKQLARQVELNLALKRVQAQLAAAREQL
ncbi:MAG: DUF4391 domain-containing protein [Glaciimonas sp.]|nr:DUF4391 domain-containing protein [Glaciimonas sp.]